MQLADWRNKLGCTGDLSDLHPWTRLPNLKYTGISPTKRILEIMDATTIEILGGAAKTRQILSGPSPAMTIRRAMSHVLLDVSQNPCRKAFSSSCGIAKCLTTATTLYSFSRDRAVLSFEKMLLQGHSMSLRVPDSMSDKALNNLAGMGISLPSLGAIIVALMCSTGL